MIKVRYDSNTGKIGNSYPDSIDVPQPYIEMTEADHDTLRLTTIPNGQNWFAVDGKWIIRDDVQYLNKQHNNEIYAQLNEIDQKSIRALRAGETDRLTEYETQAKELRSQLIS